MADEVVVGGEEQLFLYRGTPVSVVEQAARDKEEHDAAYYAAQQAAAPAIPPLDQPSTPPDGTGADSPDAGIALPPDPGPPDAGTAVTGVSPSTGPPNKVTHVVITGTGLSNAKQVFIGKSCHNTVVVDSSTVNADTPGNQGAGSFPVTVQMQDNSQTIGPNFTYS